MGSNGTAIFEINEVIADSVSLASSFTSDVVETKELKTLFIQAVWSGGGSPVGTLELQASSSATGTFTRIEGSVLGVIGNSGSDGWNVANAGFPFLLVAYTRTSGTGTITITASGKSL